MFFSPVRLWLKGCDKYDQVKATMEQHTFKNANNYLNTNIYSYLKTSGGQSSNLYLNAVHFLTPELIRHLWQLKTFVFLHWCLICAVLIPQNISSSYFCFEAAAEILQGHELTLEWKFPELLNWPYWRQAIAVPTGAWMNCNKLLGPFNSYSSR